MIEAYKKFWRNYANFQDCSSVSDYWYVILVNFIIGFVLAILNLEYSAIYALYLVASFIPSIALVVRRLHDTNRSGWNYLILLVPVAGVFIMLYYLVSKRVEPNNYGEQAK